MDVKVEVQLLKFEGRYIFDGRLNMSGPILTTQYFYEPSPIMNDKSTHPYIYLSIYLHISKRRGGLER